jgi:hypothetical protein
METNKSLENALFDTLTNNSIELTTEIGEITIDQFIDNDFLRDIPFFSLFYKSFKTISGLKEALFAMKVYKFLKEFEAIKLANKQKFTQKLSSDKKERTKIGQALIIILDKLDELSKTQMIAKLFGAYLKSELTQSEFIHLCSIVQLSYLDYLLEFCKAKKLLDISYEIQSYLSNYGLMLPIVMDTKSEYGSSVEIEENKYYITYVVTKIGSKMMKHAV